MKQKLTQQRLKFLLHYDPYTGIFTWIRPYARGIKPNDVAGYTDWSNGNKYRRITIDGVKYRAGRLAFLYMIGRWPCPNVAYNSHDKLDNSWSNLYETTTQGNQRNRKLGKNNTSGTVGVTWCEKTANYNAYITIKYNNINLGYYNRLGDAITARKAAEKAHGFHKNHGTL